MVTPELLEYMRGEIAKGKAREEIHKVLISGGGWTEDDLSEAFRIIIPFSPLSFYSPSVSILEPKTESVQQKPTSTHGMQNLAFVIVGLACVVSWYFYRPQIVSYWNTGVKSSQELSINSWNSLEKIAINSWNSIGEFSVNSWNSGVSSLGKIHIPSFSLPSFKLPSFNLSFLNKSKDVAPNTPVKNNTNNTNNAAAPVPVVAPVTVAPPVIQIKDCGTMSSAPKLDVSSTYENDPVLSCLGLSAANCENATGILKDDIFPTIFEITKTENSCNFKLSYGVDNTLTDIAGNKLAGQYVSCPLDIVKAIDNTIPSTPKFIVSDKTDLSKYASQIYFYGTLGLFVENNLDQNKIKSLGCEGKYVQSMIASYNLAQKN